MYKISIKPTPLLWAKVNKRQSSEKYSQTSNLATTETIVEEFILKDISPQGHGECDKRHKGDARAIAMQQAGKGSWSMWEGLQKL